MKTHHPHGYELHGHSENPVRLFEHLRKIQEMLAYQMNRRMSWVSLGEFATAQGVPVSTVTRLQWVLIRERLAGIEGMYLGELCHADIWDKVRVSEGGIKLKGPMGIPGLGRACAALLTSWAKHLKVFGVRPPEGWVKPDAPAPAAADEPEPVPLHEGDSYSLVGSCDDIDDVERDLIYLTGLRHTLRMDGPALWVDYNDFVALNHGASMSFPKVALTRAWKYAGLKRGERPRGKTAAPVPLRIFAGLTEQELRQGDKVADQTVMIVKRLLAHYGTSLRPEKVA